RWAAGVVGRRLDELAHQRGPLAHIDVLARAALLGGLELELEAQAGRLLGGVLALLGAGGDPAPVDVVAAADLQRRRVELDRQLRALEPDLDRLVLPRAAG